MEKEISDEPASYAPPPREFGEAIKVCFQKYVDFNGRASRSEFWFFQLFYFIVYGGLLILTIGVSELFAILNGIFILAIFLPGLAVTVRRLHDIGQSGLWLLLIYPLCIIIVGYIWLLVWLVKPSDLNDNGF